MTACFDLVTTVDHVLSPVKRANALKWAGIRSDVRGVHWLYREPFVATQSPSSGSRLCGPMVDSSTPSSTVCASAA